MGNWNNFGILVLLSSVLIFCAGEPIFFKNNDIFTVTGDIEPMESIFLKNDSMISVGDRGNSLTLICNASCPVEWKLEKYRFKSFPEELQGKNIQFKTARRIADFENPSTYEYTAEMKIGTKSNKVTGNYICQCSDGSSLKNTSVYVYWEGSSPSYLLQDGEQQTVLRSRDSPFARIYCGVSRPDQKVYLHKINKDEVYRRTVVVRHTPVLMATNGSSVTQDVDGFILNLDELGPTAYGNYICSLKMELTQRDIEADGVRASSTPKIRIEVANKFPRRLRQKQITSYHEMSRESENLVFYDHRDNTLICCDENKGGSHEQVGFYCVNPLQCNFYKYRLSDGHNANAQNETCTSYKIGKSAFSGAATFRCIFSENNALVKTDLDVRGEQFFSLHSDTYFGLDEANPSRMVRVRLENMNSTLFFGEPLKFKCEIASYPFSEGIVWVLKRQDGSKIVVDKAQEKPEYKIESVISEFEIMMRILDRKINTVVCHAPIWNSDKWWSSQISLNFSESGKPKIIGDADVTLIISSGDKLVTAECVASGIPKPTLKWKKDGKDFQPHLQVIKSTDENTTVIERIHIPLIGIEHDEYDSYECVAVNRIGEATKSFHLRPAEYNTKMIVGISVGLLVVFVIIMIFLLRKIFVQRKELRHLTKAEIEEFEKGKPEALANWKGDTNGCSHLLPYNSAYEISRIILHVDEATILGQGTYGIVMKGLIRKGTRNEKVVAVKTIKPNEDVMHFKILLCELKIMAFIGSHPNIVSLVGACSRNIRNRELLVAIEFCDNGNLHDYLRKCRESYKNLFFQYDKKANIPPESRVAYENIPMSTFLASTATSDNRCKLDSKQLLVWALQIATGMEFLSSRKVIHGDLAARNILLTGDNTAKIGDFGLSKQIFEYTTYTKKTIVLLPWKWMALESLQDMTFSVSSDVWAYGVTLWEMFTLAQTPYPGTSWDDKFIDKLIADFRLPQPQFASTEIYELMLTCWARRPEHRPSFTDIKETFMNFISELQEKLNKL